MSLKLSLPSYSTDFLIIFRKLVNLMRLEQLSFLVEVAKTNSINIAAEHVYVTQQGISDAIQKLESELGVQLLHRTHQGVFLTEAGVGVVEKAKKVLDDIADIRDFCENQDGSNNNDEVEQIEGDLSINVPVCLSQAILPNAIPVYAKSFPNVHLDIEERGSLEIIDNIRNGQTDLGVIALTNKVLKDKIKDMEKDIVVEKLAYGKWHVAASKYSPLARKKNISVKEILTYPLAFYYPAGDNHFISLLKQYGEPNILLNTNCGEIYYKTVVQGLAIGFITDLIFKNTERSSNDLVYIPISNNIKLVVALLYLKKNPLSKPAQEFIKVFKQHTVFGTSM